MTFLAKLHVHELSSFPESCQCWGCILACWFLIILHFHLQPQFKYKLFHIYRYFTSFHSTGRYELKKLTSLLMCGFIAQLVEHCTGISGSHGFKSRWSPDFFRLLLFNFLNWKIYCDDQSSLLDLYTGQKSEFISVAQFLGRKSPQSTNFLRKLFRGS